ncbi:BREX system P-loop protein BrxC [Azospirillum argentinense]|uniref:BREX system P-loop protein BrxC n=1 Tax=Azospirillum brasilense TaxID=192 RepID=A0A4D8Q033_AZOBR|nr:BREX system P-loop protein BrxC [Azospirillum argentinense]QCO03445.1 BREX system P-loop protein BrxC [Azospirillum argentinense]
MKLADVLQRDPRVYPLVNNGQARLADPDAERAARELRGELETFVCEGQYADGIARIVRSFLDGVGRTSQKGAWVSGFYGSGKSHLLKMLCHLWINTPFSDGLPAREVVPALGEDLKALFRELDTAGRRAGGVLAAAGAMPNGGTDAVRLTILSTLLNAVGLPEQYAPARFCLWLHAQGQLDTVRQAVVAAGKEFRSELTNLYVSPVLARAVLNALPGIAANEAEIRQMIRAQFPQRTTDISTNEFLDVARQALLLAGKDGKMPLTLLVLDEVQQYIGLVHDRSVLVSEVAEAVSKQLDSHVMIIGAGQSALSSAPNLERLLDRFTVRVALSDAEVETVTRQVLLRKDATAIDRVRAVLDSNAGEVSRQLRGTRIGEGPEDRPVLVDDYPLLPVRRRFWDECFRQIDDQAMRSQLRSQLRIVHDALAERADCDLGVVIPADELYDALAMDMVQTGSLLRELYERIIRVGQEVGPLARRVCSIVFLIGKLKREAGADTGVRATKEHIADLLVDDLTADNGKLRSEVDDILKRLVERGDLMPVGDEYRLQTREGAEWDREFRRRQGQLLSDTTAIYFKRDELLYAEVSRIVGSVTLRQGAAKEPRTLALHRGEKEPPADEPAIPVWVRDGWSCTVRQVEESARAAGVDSPTVFVHIPQRSAEDLRRLITDADAARQTLEAKGMPATDEGKEARLSMESRFSRARDDLDALVREIVANARVFQGGGGELVRLSLAEQVQAAAEDALVRQFPRFKEADSANWELAIKRAREGADSPFQAVGHGGPLDQHPVCQQVLGAIGAGRSGADVRKDLRGAPFGWPKDAIDAALLALHRAEMITATLNGAAIPPGQLDQNKITKTDFRREGVTLSMGDRLVLRKLFLQVGVVARGDELAKAPEFLAELARRAEKAGGGAPLPAPPSLAEVDDLRRMVGNEQLAALRAKVEELGRCIERWSAAGALAEQRLPSWRLAERMARHAEALPSASGLCAQAEAIRDQRLLLEPTDPVTPVRAGLANVLREAVNTAHAELAGAHAAGMAELDGNDLWRQLPEAERAAILATVELSAPAAPDVSSDEALLGGLDARPLSTMRAEADAIPGRIRKAVEMAARALEPQVRTLHLERATLRSQAEVDAWVERARATLVAAVNDGPVLVG